MCVGGNRCWVPLHFGDMSFLYKCTKSHEWSKADGDP